MLPPVVFLDTSFVIALENKKDEYHTRAKLLDREMVERDVGVILHTGIVMEIGDGFAKLDRREKGIALLKKFLLEDSYRLVRLTDALVDQASQLYQDRRDKEWSLTDCASFVVMTQEGLIEALSSDVHFRQAGFKALLLDPE